MFWMFDSSRRMSLAILQRSLTSDSFMHSQFFRMEICLSRSEFLLLLNPFPLFIVMRLCFMAFRRLSLSLYCSRSVFMSSSLSRGDLLTSSLLMLALGGMVSMPEMICWELIEASLISVPEFPPISPE